MTIPTFANYVFLPWARQGAAADIQTPDSLGQDQAGIASTTVKLRINDAVDIDRQVRLYGPGDITGIDTQQVIRTEPRHLATDFEPNYFPAVEFDRPDFPWLFTPAKAGAAGKLRPWLCLVVVRKQEGVTLRAGIDLPLPALEIKAPALPARELPDLSESWAWAHAQIAGSAPQPEPLKKALEGDPALTVSRLLCPRRLDPETEYLACVVPTFDLGRKAGLGQTIDSTDLDKLKPAWISGEQAPAAVTLPVYFHWEFRTAAGEGSDFEALVRLLEPREMPAQAGKRRMNISQPGFQIDPPLESDVTLEIEGALQALGSESADWPEGTRPPFQDKLKEILNAPWHAMNEAPTQERTDPLFAPPIYGRWQAAQHVVEIPTEPPDQTLPGPWLHELNLDPRQRAVAALGTRVVQAQQEELMASAWEQMGEIEQINQMKRQAQLARAVNAVYHTKHFKRFSEEALLKVVSPAQSRITIPIESTGMNYGDIEARSMLSYAISRSAIPNRAVSAPLRRLASPRGVVSARFQQVEEPPIAVVAKLNTITPIVPTQKPEAGLVMLDQVAEGPNAGGAAGLKDTADFHRISNALDTSLNTPPKLTNFNVAAEGTARTLFNFNLGASNSPDAQAFLTAAKAHQQYLDFEVFPSSLTSPAQPMDLEGAKEALLQNLDPDKTINARMQASFSMDGAAEETGDPLEPIMDAPEFSQPMYEALRDISQDFLFPGLEHVPPNTATLLKTNSKFIEAFMVGLNTEMSAELLWRNFPTDQRGTYFRHFWDSNDPDIEKINEWGDHNLGENAIASDNLVLLIRGELLRRYPNSVIYAVKAVEQSGQIDLSTNPADELHPLFRGTLKPYVTFLGFDLTHGEALAGHGWFFVIQQQPTEPRFGMDAANFDEQGPPPLTTWDNLNWRHMADTEEELNALSHASISRSMPDIDTAKWGKNSAHQAYITLQRPVRIAIHASEMIPQG
jgi:hypothetical protein